MRDVFGGGVLLLALAAAGARGADAPVYKCESGDGRVAYQDRACADARRETRIAIAPSPPPAPSPRYAVASARAIASERRAPAARHESATRRIHGASRRGRDAEPVSYECRAANGEVFYRHSACPRTIALGRDGRRGAASAPVSAIALPRAEACRRAAESVGRSGRERDDRVSTYERNLGRDPCRRL
ncbi:MAG TPA: DUF4124 domain-containing protein [Dokdonella sp.]